MQDFYPTPGTVSTVAYYTGINPLTNEKIHVTRDYKEKQMQRALLQYKKPENADLVRRALTKCGRTDLIGFGKECLVRPAGGTVRPAGGHASQNGAKSAKSHAQHAGGTQTRSADGGAGNRKTSSPSKKGWAKAKPKPTGTKKKKK